MSTKNENIGAEVEKVKILANPENFITKLFPCDLTKKMNTNTLCFCPLINRLKVFEILKWAQGSQWRKQRTSSFTRETQLIYSASMKKLPVSKIRYFGKYLMQLFGYCYIHVSVQRQADLER